MRRQNYNSEKAIRVAGTPVDKLTPDDVRYLATVVMQTVAVRRIQRDYFRHRSTADLNTAREMERELDALMQGPSDPSTTPGLFGEGSE